MGQWRHGSSVAVQQCGYAKGDERKEIKNENAETDIAGSKWIWCGHMSASCNHRIYLSCSCQFQSCSPVTGDYSSRHILYSSTTMAAVKPHPTITILKRTREDQHLSQNKFLKKTARGKVINSESLLFLPTLTKASLPRTICPWWYPLWIPRLPSMCTVSRIQACSPQDRIFTTYEVCRKWPLPRHWYQHCAPPGMSPFYLHSRH